jgi:hypothetical protein
MGGESSCGVNTQSYVHILVNTLSYVQHVKVRLMSTHAHTRAHIHIQTHTYFLFEYTMNIHPSICKHTQSHASNRPCRPFEPPPPARTHACRDTRTVEEVHPKNGEDEDNQHEEDQGVRDDGRCEEHGANEAAKALVAPGRGGGGGGQE